MGFRENGRQASYFGVVSQNLLSLEEIDYKTYIFFLVIS